MEITCTQQLDYITQFRYIRAGCATRLKMHAHVYSNNVPCVPCAQFGYD